LPEVPLPAGRTAPHRKRGWLGHLAAAVALAGCATNPVTGDSDFVLMSEDQELALGRQASQQLARIYPRYADEDLQRYVQSLGERLAARSHRPNLIYRFTVVDSSEVNAFALPGGYIYITRGMLGYLNGESELAGVLGHEIGHVTARHGVRQASAAQAAQIGSTLGAIFFPVLRNQATGGLVNMLGTALLRGYGRDMELEADRLGAIYLGRAGMPPGAMLDVLSVLKDQEQVELATAQAEGREPRTYHGVFSTHPDNDRRLQEAVAAGATLGVDMSVRETMASRKAFLERLDGLAFGERADEGVVRDGRFLHQEMGFTFAIPSGWRVDNRPDRVALTAPGGVATLQMAATDLSRRTTPREFMLREMGLSGLTAEGDISHDGIPGHSAVARLNGESMRVNVMFLDNRAFYFVGSVRDAARIAELDSIFLDTARSFRRINGTERALAEPLRIRLLVADQTTTIAKLAARSPLGPRAEAQLRLLNDLYPQGEPQAGQILKVVQ
jgi:predicted Zn-dependent protease